jgi:hypothetical protein
MKKTTFIILSFIAFAICLTNYPTPFTIDLSKRTFYIILFLAYVALTSLLVTKLEKAYSNPIIILVKTFFLLIPTILLIHFDKSANFGYYLAGILFVVMIYINGRLISRLLFKNIFKETPLLTFTCGYIISVFFISIPLNFIPNSTIALPSKIITIVFAIFILCEIVLTFTDLKRNLKIPKENVILQHESSYFYYLACWIVFLLLSFGLILSWSYDDLNSYLYWPLKAVQENITAVNINRPVTFTLLSVHSQSVLTYLFSLFSVHDGIIATYIYRGVNASCFCALFISGIHSVKFLKKINLSNLFFLLNFLVATLPMTFNNIYSNYTDFPAYLAFLSSLFILFSVLSNAQEINNNHSYLFFKNILSSSSFSLLGGMLIAISPKTIAPIFSAIFSLTLFRIIFLLRMQSISRISIIKSILPNRNSYFTILINAVILVLPISIIAIRNFVITGNPSFPANNVFWKSHYFITASDFDPAKSHYSSNLPLDFTYLPRLFSNNLASLQGFEYADTSFGMFGAFLINLLILYGVYKILFSSSRIFKSFPKTQDYQVKISSDFLVFSIVLIFYLSINTFIVYFFLGDQYRYLISVYLSGVTILLLFCLYNFPQKLKKIFAGTIQIFLFIQIFVSIYWFISIQTIQGKLSSGDWQDYFNVISDVKNNIIQSNSQKNYLTLSGVFPKGLIFLFPLKIHTNDWYDYSFQENLIKKATKIYKDTDKLYGTKKTNEFLKNNSIKFFLMSDDSYFISPDFDSKNLIVVKRYDSRKLTLYELK